MNEDDRPWSDLTEAEQDALMEEAGPGHVSEVEVEDVAAHAWGVWQDSGDHDPDDVHREGVDAQETGGVG